MRDKNLFEKIQMKQINSMAKYRGIELNCNQVEKKISSQTLLMAINPQITCAEAWSLAFYHILLYNGTVL